jgi:hypothetical protein
MMALYKAAQLMEANDDIADFGDEDEVILYDEKPSKDDVIEMHRPDEEIELTFKLPHLPGSDAGPLEVSTDDAVEVKEKDKKKEDKNDLAVSDPWDWEVWMKEHGGDGLGWVQDRLRNIPRHSGRETAGIERVISYMRRLNAEMSKMAANDFDGKINIGKFEEARREIYSAIDRLEKAKEQLEQQNYKKKKGDLTQEGLVKEAKQDRIGGIIITVPLLISSIARTAINSMISAGKDIEITTNTLIKKYNLNDREQMELLQLLSDMGYAIQKPRGDKLDEKFDRSSVDNNDYIAQYYS